MRFKKVISPRRIAALEATIMGSLSGGVADLEDDERTASATVSACGESANRVSPCRSPERCPHYNGELHRGQPA
jgi:hypothetical protein